MATAEHRNHAKSFLTKAEEHLASAEANLAAQRYTPAADDAIHAGINAKDAIVTALTGTTRKGKDHAIAAKGEVEYGTALVTASKAEPLVRRARTLVDLAIGIVRLGR